MKIKQLLLLFVVMLQITSIKIIAHENYESNIAESIPRGDEVFTTAAQMPSFPGGEKALYEYCGRNIRYPQDAADNNIQGTVIVKFVVEKDGRVGQVEVLQSVDRSLDNEARRVCKSLPKFSPGRNENGDPVRVWVTMPFDFYLTPNSGSSQKKWVTLSNENAHSVFIPLKIHIYGIKAKIEEYPITDQYIGVSFVGDKYIDINLHTYYWHCTNERKVIFLDQIKPDSDGYRNIDLAYFGVENSIVMRDFQKNALGSNIQVLVDEDIIKSSKKKWVTLTKDTRFIQDRIQIYGIKAKIEEQPTTDQYIGVSFAGDKDIDINTFNWQCKIGGKKIKLSKIKPDSDGYRNIDLVNFGIENSIVLRDFQKNALISNIQVLVEDDICFFCSLNTEQKIKSILETDDPVLAKRLHRILFYPYNSKIGNNNGSSKNGLLHGMEYSWEDIFKLQKYFVQHFTPDELDEAYYWLGCYYNYGYGTEIDLAEAFNCYLKAAEAGNGDAMFEVSRCFADGVGCNKNPELAYFWARNADEVGNLDAYALIARYYAEGIGVEKDQSKSDFLLLENKYIGSYRYMLDRLTELTKESLEYESGSRSHPPFYLISIDENFNNFYLHKVKYGDGYFLLKAGEIWHSFLFKLNHEWEKNYYGIHVERKNQKRKDGDYDCVPIKAEIHDYEYPYIIYLYINAWLLGVEDAIDRLMEIRFLSDNPYKSNLNKIKPTKKLPVYQTEGDYCPYIESKDGGLYSDRSVDIWPLLHALKTEKFLTVLFSVKNYTGTVLFDEYIPSLFLVKLYNTPRFKELAKKDIKSLCKSELWKFYTTKTSFTNADRELIKIMVNEDIEEAIELYEAKLMKN